MNSSETTDDSPFIPSETTDDSPFIPSETTDDSPFIPSETTDDSPFIPSETTDDSPFIPSVTTDFSWSEEGRMTMKLAKPAQNLSSAQQAEDSQDQAQMVEPTDTNLKKSKFSSMMDLLRRKSRIKSTHSIPDELKEDRQEPTSKSRERHFEAIGKRLRSFTVDFNKLRRRHRSDTSACQALMPAVAPDSEDQLTPQTRRRGSSMPPLPMSRRSSKIKNTALEASNDLSSNNENIITPVHSHGSTSNHSERQTPECTSKNATKYVLDRSNFPKAVTLNTCGDPVKKTPEKSLIDELSFATFEEAEEIYFPAKALKGRRSFPSGHELGNLRETCDVLLKQCEHFISLLTRVHGLSKKILRTTKNKTLASALTDHVSEMISHEQKVLSLLKEENFNPISFASEAKSFNLTSYEFLHVEFSKILSLREGGSFLRDTSWEILCKYLIAALDGQKNLILMFTCLLPHCENKETIRDSLSTLADAQKKCDTKMVLNSLINCPIRLNKISTLEYFSDVESKQLSSDLMHLVRFENFLMFCKPSFARLEYVYHYRIDQINRFIINGHKVHICGQNGNSNYEDLELTLAGSDQNNFESCFNDVINFCSVASFEMKATIKPSDFDVPSRPKLKGSLPFSIVNIFDELDNASKMSDPPDIEPPLVSLELLRRKLLGEEKKYVSTLDAAQNQDVPPPVHHAVKQKISEIHTYHSSVFYPWVEEASHEMILKTLQGFCLKLQLYEEFIQIRSYCAVLFNEDLNRLFYVSPIRRLVDYLTYLKYMNQYSIFQQQTKPLIDAISRCVGHAKTLMHTQLIENCTIDFFRLGNFMAECPIFSRDKTELRAHMLVLFTKAVLVVNRSGKLHVLDSLLWFEQMHDFNIKTEKRTIFFKYHQGSQHKTYRFFGYESYQQLFEQVMNLIDGLYNEDPVKNSWNMCASRITTV